MQFEAKDGEATIWIYDPIGEMFGPDAVTAKGMRDALKNRKGIDRLNVRINSPGGIVDDANAIHTLLSEFSAEKIMKIDGIAASAAALVPMAGDKIEVAPGAMMMIHNPWSIAIGDGDEMRKAAEISDKYRDSIAGITANRTGQSREDVLNAMAAETWFTAEEAVEWGMADAIAGEAVEASRDVHEKIISYAKEVARIAAMSLVAEAGSDAADRVADQALDVGRRISADSRKRRLDLAKMRAALN